jgi:hypothetical protein
MCGGAVTVSLALRASQLGMRGGTPTGKRISRHQAVSLRAPDHQQDHPRADALALVLH